MAQVTTNCTTLELDFSKKNYQDSRQKLADYLGLSTNQIKTLTQAHTDKICIVESLETQTNDITADCIITNLKNLCIGIKTADCIPLIIFDPVNEVIAAVHLGRKGVLQNLLEKTIITIKERFNSDTKDLLIWMYPSLQKNSHIVFSEEADKFPPKYAQYLPKGVYSSNNPKLLLEFLEKNNLEFEDLKNYTSAKLDLPAFVKDKLSVLGVLQQNIVENQTDSYEDRNYHSYRRDYPNNGLMLSYIIMH